MMKKLKKSIALVLFAAIVIALALRVNRIFGYEDNVHSKAVFEQFYALPENTMDVVWIGPSSVQQDVIPTVMFDNEGVALYPIGLGNLPVNALEFMIRECEKTQDPQIYMIEIRSVAYEVLSKENIRRITDNMAFSKNRFATIARLENDLHRFRSPNGHIEGLSDFDFYIPFMMNHARWDRLKEADFVPDRDCFLGYWINTQTQAFDKEEVTKLLATPDRELSEENSLFLKEFLDYCDTLDKKIIFTNNPHCLHDNICGRLNYAMSYIQQRGYEVWDMNQEADAMGLDYTADFSDEYHLNVYGAQKLSAHVASTLADRYGLPDHRNDASYEFLRTYSKAFRTALQEKNLVATENVEDYFTQLNAFDSRYTVFVTVKGGQGAFLPAGVPAAMKAMGLQQADRLLEETSHSYIGVIWDGKLHFETVGENQSRYRKNVNGMTVEVNSGSTCSVTLGITQYSMEARGLNIVVINNQNGEIIDSVAFDTSVEALTCTRKTPPQK